MSDINIAVQTSTVAIAVTENAVVVDVQESPVQIVVSGGVGPVGPAGANGVDGIGSNNPTIIFNQQTVSDHWVIPHSWPGFPAVTVVDTSGNILVGDVKYTTPTLIEIFFSPVPVNGKAYLN